ncbi:MAG TPA: hypothetical protein VGC79_24015 [Polyangiaceae bacterium]
MELPNREVRHGLVQAYAEVVASLDLSAERALVLPNGEFFPDLFTADEASVQRMLDRLLKHAGISDMALVARFWGSQSAASCGTGACGSCGPTEPDPESESVQRLVDAGEHWQLNVLPAEVASPVALSSALCHGIALAVLREADSPPRLPLELALDLTAIALGYGVLLLEGSHIYRKSCGGPSIARTTALGPSEVSLVLALSAAANQQSLRKVGKHLSPTQQEAFNEAMAWADSNPALVQSVRADPKRVARGEFALKDASSWFGRWLGSKIKRPPSLDSASTIEELEAALEAAPAKPLALKPRDPKLDEIRRLVDEALNE